MVKDLGWMAGLALEFFWGEAIYSMEESLRRLRKWRLIVACIPFIGLFLVLFCAVTWPQVDAINSRDIGKLEFKVEQLEKEANKQNVLMDKLVDDMNMRAMTIVEIRGQITAINQKLDLVGWLIGAAAVAFVGQSISYFYQLRLRKTLRGIEKRASFE